MTVQPNILVVGPAWIGDMVMAQSLFKVLKARAPGGTVSVAAPAVTAPLLERMPEVDVVIDTPFRHNHLQLRERYSLGRSLRRQGYDRAIVLPGSIKAALLPFFAAIPTRSGYRGEPRWGLVNDCRVLDQGVLSRQIDRFVQLSLPPGSPPASSNPLPRLVTRPEQAPRIIERLGLTVSPASALALCPGAEFGPAKRWPSRHFATLASHFLGQGWQVWLLGSEVDAPTTRDINQQTGDRCLDLSGHTSLLEVVDLLAAATAIVSNDSGLMHVGAASGQPVVGIFGSSSAANTPPLSDRARAISLDLPCSPCFARHCPLSHTDCLEQLLPQQVIAAVAALPGIQDAPGA
ncbi:MAG: lipopolysaccharide heptosyltransferase II [Arenicellales bacterium]|jgi:heptosyltransferase-2|nr:lipopolysaccharide heptosyltransferase II [Arenicellales bacterium]